MPWTKFSNIIQKNSPVLYQTEGLKIVDAALNCGLSMSSDALSIFSARL